MGTLLHSATRYAIYGPSGSGKSTLGRALAEARGLPYIELDALMHHAPGWLDATTDEFRAKVADVLAANPAGWVIDGNYHQARDLILARAEVAVRLRLPFRIVYPRLVRRTLRRTVRHELLWGTNYETWRDTLSRESMLVWGIRHWRAHHRRLDAALAQRPPGVRLIELRTTGAVDALLRRLSTEYKQHGLLP